MADNYPSGYGVKEGQALLVGSNIPVAVDDWLERSAI
jgi:hypothetical protein